jgi:NAD(P)-dependent dehydrogenase (short-subunit alcohol dehydrogenase family)
VSQSHDLNKHKEAIVSSAFREVVVITGASAGVGRATTRAFARRGACIGLLSRGREALEATAAEVKSLGGKALVVPADVAVADQVEAAAASVEEAFGPIDIWINNAMTTVFSPVSEISPEEYRRVTEVTYLGAVWGTMAALRRMRKRNHGVIVQVSSALAYRSIPLQGAYCGAKHALRGFMSSLRSELRHENSRIHVTMVHMPALNTPQFEWGRTHMSHEPQPMPPIFQPEVAADAIYWAAHHRRRDLFVGLPSVITAWVNRIAPGLADWYLARTAYESQHTDQPVDPERVDNLWTPVGGDYSARGHFSHVARDYSPQQWISRNRGWLALACVVVGGWALSRRLNKGNYRQLMRRRFGD